MSSVLVVAPGSRAGSHKTDISTTFMLPSYVLTYIHTQMYLEVHTYTSTYIQLGEMPHEACRCRVTHLPRYHIHDDAERNSSMHNERTSNIIKTRDAASELFVNNLFHSP